MFLTFSPRSASHPCIQYSYCIDLDKEKASSPRCPGVNLRYRNKGHLLKFLPRFRRAINGLSKIFPRSRSAFHKEQELTPFLLETACDSTKLIRNSEYINF